MVLRRIVFRLLLMLALSFLAFNLLFLPVESPVTNKVAKSPTANSVSVTIDAEHILQVNGQNSVPDGLFGVTAYYGSNFPINKSYLPLLQASGIRWIGLPGATHRIMPAARPQNFPGGFMGWSQTPEAHRLLHQGTGVDFKKALPAVDFEKALPAWRKLGITPMIYLLGYPSWLASPVPQLPTNYQEAGTVLAEYVALLRQADPQLTWFHLGNEPNARYNRWFKAKKNGQDYGELFRTVASVIHARNPGIKIGGPVITWFPSQSRSKLPDWYNWNAWTMPVIEKAGRELDFFDFHLYSQKDPKIALGGVQAITNAMWLKTGQRKPVIISEYGHYLRKQRDVENPTIVWQQRIELWQNQIMAFLEYQPDKVVSLQIHDLYAQGGGKFRLIKGKDPNDQFDFYRMLQTWRYFSGKRLLTKSSSSNIHAFASFKQSEIVVVLVNTSNQLQKTNLNITGLSQSSNQHPLETSQDFIRLHQTASTASPDTQEGMSSSASRIEWGQDIKSPLAPEITLQPEETRSIRIFLPMTLKPSKLLETVESYGDQVHVPFKNGVGEEIEFKVTSSPQKLQDAINPRLRIGMLAGRPGDKIQLSVNGQSQMIKSDWFQEIPLRNLSTNNQLIVRLKLLKRGLPEERPTLLHVSSVSLQVDREIQ